MNANFLKDNFPEYHEHCLHRNSENTYKAAVISISEFADWLLEIVDFELDEHGIDSIDTIIIEKYAYAMLDKGLSKSSVNQKLCFIRQLLKKYDNMSGFKVDSYKLPKRLSVHYNIKEINKLFKAIKGTKYEARDVALISFALNTGLRLEEIAEVKIKDIKDGFVRVLGKGEADKIREGGKGSKQRDVPVPSIVAEYLEIYFRKRPLRKPDSPLFTQRYSEEPLSTQAIYKVISKHEIKAGLPTGVHILRHTYATMLYKSGMDIGKIQSLLGHSDIKTTMIYISINNDELKEEVNGSLLNVDFTS